jgi:hypothetical protein
MKKALYIGLSCIAPLAILAATIFIVRAEISSGITQMIQYRYAFYSFAVVALCIELRVRMGYRLQRTSLFRLHLSCAVPLFILLAVLAYVLLPAWISLLEGFLFAIVLCTGVILYTRGLRKELFTKYSAKF